MSDISLNSAREQFSSYLKDKRCANATIIAYSKDIEQLEEFAAKQAVTDLDQISGKLIEDYKTQLKQQDYTTKSISRKINSIKSFFRFLKANDIIKSNPATEVTHPKVEISPPRILNRTEYRALRDACRNDERMYAIIELLLQTGVRISELANLQLDDIVQDGKKIEIRSEAAHEQRVIPLNRSAIKALDMYLKYRPQTSSQKLFVTKTGRPFLIRNIRAAIDRYFKIAGIKNAKVNDLRHTFITEQLAAGTPLVYVSRLVGHKRLTTTEKYLKFLDQKLDKEEVQLQEL